MHERNPAIALGKRMKRIITRPWSHVIIIIIMFTYVIVAPRIYGALFVNEGKPLANDVAITYDSIDAHFAIDGLILLNSKGVYNLTGWAFPVTSKWNSTSEYSRRLLLYSNDNKYLFQGENQSRVDIQTVFNDLTLDVTKSGFSVKIYKDSIVNDTYGLGLIFLSLSDGANYYIDLNKCITRTPNQLLLANMMSAACREITNNLGKPTNVNSPLPKEIQTAKLAFEGLTALDKHGVYQLSGWAFPVIDAPSTDCGYEMQVIIISADGNYTFPALTITRTDIQSIYRHLDLSIWETGFTSVIDANAIDSGSYTLGLLFSKGKNDTSYYYNTKYSITNLDGVLSSELFDIYTGDY